jgi:hypothetical protein
VSPGDNFELFEQIRVLLPKYLTPAEKDDLFEELKRFPDNASFYFDRDDLRSELLQGDGWRGLVAIDFLTGNRKAVSGVILSNSCDIDSANLKAFPVNILFAPIIKLGKYVEKLRVEGRVDDQIQSLLTTIRKQRVANIFYLPSCPGITEEGFILMDDIHAHPLSDFLTRDRQPLFKLNQFFFYFFIIKLSIHFCRFQEGVHRFAASA